MVKAEFPLAQFFPTPPRWLMKSRYSLHDQVRLMNMLRETMQFIQASHLWDILQRVPGSVTDWAT